MAANEFIAGTPIQIIMTFTDEVTNELQDPSVVTGLIQLGAVGETSYFYFADMVQISTGVWYYIYPTAGVTPGGYSVQVQSTSALNAISAPVVFTILAPMGILT